MENKIQNLFIDYNNSVELSPYIFGHNLEHTRACVMLSGQTYEMRIVAVSSAPITLTVSLTDAGGQKNCAQTQLTVTSGNWQTLSFTMTPDTTDENACLRYTFTD